MKLPNEALGADHPVNLLRELVAPLEAIATSPKTGSRLAFVVRTFLSALRLYEVEAPSGMTLDKALGLKKGVGSTKWWTAERLAERNRIIRDVRRRHYEQHGDWEAARLMLKAANRLVGCAPPREGPGADLALAQSYGNLPTSDHGFYDIITEDKDAK